MNSRRLLNGGAARRAGWKLLLRWWRRP